VLGGNAHDLAEWGLETTGGGADDLGFAGHGRGVVVVEVLVRDQKQVGMDPVDRLVVEAAAA
jgi:hypothetical protein